MLKNKTISVLSIPGLPNGFLPLDSKLYHDYESILAVIQEVLGPEVTAHFQAYIWPEEIKHPHYEGLLKTPALAIPANYLVYQLDAEFRERVVKRAIEYIEEAFSKGGLLFLILHSHGNRIALDALLELKRTGKLEGRHIVVLSFAPAYKEVAGGWVPPGLSANEIKEIEKSVDVLINFRMKTDLLSGDPGLEKMHLFDPKFYERVWLGHATIRSRKDVMEALKKELLEIFNSEK